MPRHLSILQRAVGPVLPALFGLLVLVLVLVPAAPAPAQRSDIDFDKARQLRQRARQGERLDRAGERLSGTCSCRTPASSARRGTPGAARPAARESIGLTPLTDMGAEDRYKGQEGGLYGKGENQPPETLLHAALKASGEVQPLNEKGDPTPDGTIGLISVGMSNTTREFQTFLTMVNRDEEKSPSVVVVDGAQGGMDASSWATPQSGDRAGRADPWKVLDQRLKQAGVAPEQVQVAWIKQAQANPASMGDFPRHAEKLRDNMAVIVRKLAERFPNLKLVYLSSRIYAGHAATPLNPEPYAYESAFAVRRLIRDQIEAKPGESTNPGGGDIDAPVLLWGPYLWADGVAGRQADDLVWTREDLAGDGTHPSTSGQRKVAALLLRFFKTDPTTRTWFRRPTSANATQPDAER